MAEPTLIAHRPIDPVDAIWLNMDRPTNPMVIESLMMLDGPLDQDRFVEVLRRRVLDRYPVFRQRPVSSRVPGLMSHWQDDTDFDLDQHVIRVALPDPGDHLALQRYVNGFISSTLPRDRPLWQVHVIEGYAGGTAVYSRLHHALADGIALTRVLLSLTDDSAGTAPEPPGPTEHHGGLLDATRHVLAAAGSAALHLPTMLTPGFAEDAFTLARQTTGIAVKLTFTRNPDTLLAGAARPRKLAVWAPPISLAEVAAVGARTGTTINDVLMAALAGALATYLVEHGGEPVDIPTMVPVNLRALDEPVPRELGNRFALVLVTLPSGLGTPLERLAETKRRMDAIKGSPEAWLTFGLIRGIGRTGRQLERYLVDFFADRASGVTTNVPGPRTPRYLAGTRITAMLGWAPESGDQALGTCIFTYDGSVHVGFKVDAATIPDPQELLDAYLAELDALLRLSEVR